MTDFWFDLKFALKFWLRDVRNWAGNTKWKREHGWKKQFDLIENKVCNCGEPYQLVNGYLKESMWDVLDHSKKFHPEYYKKIMEANQ